MIVSASYRTDIPAFYASWFLNRLRAGHCHVANPYGGASYRVALTPSAVDGFVFWTRNLRPLLPHLDEVRRVAPFVVQFTVTGYPRTLETSVIAVSEAMAQLQELREVHVHPEVRREAALELEASGGHHLGKFRRSAFRAHRERRIAHLQEELLLVTTARAAILVDGHSGLRRI